MKSSILSTGSSTSNWSVARRLAKPSEMHCGFDCLVTLHREIASFSTDARKSILPVTGHHVKTGDSAHALCIPRQTDDISGQCRLFVKFCKRRLNIFFLVLAVGSFIYQTPGTEPYPLITHATKINWIQLSILRSETCPRRTSAKQCRTLPSIWA
jgi:hypothetical protein